MGVGSSNSNTAGDSGHWPGRRGWDQGCGSNSSNSNKAGGSGGAGETGAKAAEAAAAATATGRLVVWRQGWLERASKRRQQPGGIPIVERQQVVGDGLPCPRAGGGGSSTRMVGGKRGCSLQVLQRRCGGAATAISLRLVADRH